MLQCADLRNEPREIRQDELHDGFVGPSAPHASAGIFNRGFAPNPVKNWTFVYVPYCTGDVHAGNHPDGTVPGVADKQQFVGYVNVEKATSTRIVPSFPGLTKVLLTGISAGGFGAASDYVQVAKAFGTVPVYEIDDSGPPMPDPYNAKCLLTEQVNLWGFDKTILKDCGTTVRFGKLSARLREARGQDVSERPPWFDRVDGRWDNHAILRFRGEQLHGDGPHGGARGDVHCGPHGGPVRIGELPELRLLHLRTSRGCQQHAAHLARGRFHVSKRGHERR